MDTAHILPSPQERVQMSGDLKLNVTSTIFYSSTLKSEAEYLKSVVGEEYAIQLRLKEIKDNSMTSETEPEEVNIRLMLSGQVDDKSESYTLDSRSNEVLISATSSKGIFYGIQSALQLITTSKEALKFPKTRLSNDQPAFAHRGLLLDACRHFWSVDVTKKYIDLLARYKMNVLHWHLTEDQGWRIEIDAYPKLTTAGAWRTETDGSRYGGFYTKDEIREVVAYAAARHITVIPEIEMPGHSLAALAAYPHLACTDGPFEVTPEWGVFKDVYCAGNDSTFLFLETVLTEVMELFPSEYIHIGGDESPKYRWEHCDQCQRRIKEEGLKDEFDLQSWFISG